MLAEATCDQGAAAAGRRGGGVVGELEDLFDLISDEVSPYKISCSLRRLIEYPILSPCTCREGKISPRAAAGKSDSPASASKGCENSVQHFHHFHELFMKKAKFLQLPSLSLIDVSKDSMKYIQGQILTYSVTE